MKKLLPYTLILNILVIVVLFLPIHRTSAQIYNYLSSPPATPLTAGTIQVAICGVRFDDNTGRDSGPTKLSQEDCNHWARNQNRAVGAIWPYPPGSEISSQQLGYCYINSNGNLYQNTTPYNCTIVAGGVWKSGTIPITNLVSCTKGSITITINSGLCTFLGGTVANNPPPPPPGCTNGATNPPNCDNQPPGRCTNGATNYPACDNNTTPPAGDVCPNIAGVQTTVPREMMRDSAGNCVPGVCTPPSTGTYPNCVLLQNGNAGYELIQKLPTVDPKFDTESPGAFGKYLNAMIKLFIGLCAVTAVVMIIIGGLEYSTSELSSNKADGKDKIQNALLGLLLALMSWLLLNTINPDLLNTDVDLADVTLDVSIPEIINQVIPVGVTPLPNSPNFTSRGGHCDANIIFRAAQDSGHPITAAQAETLGCIGGAESRGCKPIPADATATIGGGFGAFQIVISLHYDKINRSRLCQAAAGTTSVGCIKAKSTSQPASCIKAAKSILCQSAVTAEIFRLRPNYMDWLVTQNPCNNARCIRRFDPSINLNMSIPASNNTPFIPNLAVRCGIR